jgi:predicted permease
MLALAVGITTTMFTLVDAFLLRPMPFPDAERIGHVQMRGKGGGPMAVAPTVLRAWRQSKVFDAGEGVSPDTFVLGTDAGPVVRASAYVSPGMLPMLGVRPIRGRLFETGEGRGGTSDRALISEDLWRSVFAMDPAIVGRRIVVGPETLMVVGVVPKDFRFPHWNTELWRPYDYDAPPPGPVQLPFAYMRFATGVPDADALRAATAAAHVADPSTSKRWAERDLPVESYSGTQYADVSVRLLVGGVALVFLVLCANASGLLLARFNARRRDFSLCAALGASRARLLWQSSLESTLLGSGAAALGLAFTWCLVRVAVALLPVDFVERSLNPLNVDGRALAAATALATVATILAGWLPAWIGTRGTQPQRTLDRTTADSRSARVLSRVFLIIEVTLACTLVLGATLLVRSFVNLSRIELGFDPRGIVEIWMSSNRTVTDPSSRQIARQQAVSALARLPGVRQAIAFAETGTNWYGLHPDDPGSTPVRAQFHSYEVSADWFDTYGVRVLRGRSFLPDDPMDAVILSARLAAALWPGADPIGRSFYWRKNRYSVVGVVQERTSPVRDMESAFTELYAPRAPSEEGGTVSLKCGETCPSEGLIRQRILATSAMDVHAVRYLANDLRQELAQPRAMAALGGAFGLLALAAATGGLFSVLSHTVGRRRREFGIRLALGSSPQQVRRIVIRDSMTVAISGVALGAGIGWLLARTLGSLLYGVSPADPITWAVVLVALLTAALAGTWRPARQAMQIDPVALLREE